MYCDFYQMTERPFNVTPDPRCLYLNARYREALAALQYGITQRKGFITLIGEAGTGKTTLLKRLLEEFDQKTRSVFIFNTHVTFEEILEYLFAEFDLPIHNGKKLYMLQRLNTFLLEELHRGGNVALLIDEAQDLEYSVLEDLRLLSNLETAKEKILQIVLSGQPELGEKLANPNLRQLRQRIAVSCRLLPLSRDELSEYIQFRLHAVGCTDLKLFSREAEDQIYHFSHGIPRLINVVCDNALVISYALGKKRIGGDVIAEAAADLMPVQEAPPPAAPKETAPALATAPLTIAPRPRAGVGLIAVVLVAIVIGLLSVGRSMLQRQAGSERAGSEPAAVVARPPEVIRPGSLAARGDGEPVRGKSADDPALHPREVAGARATNEPAAAAPPANVAVQPRAIAAPAEPEAPAPDTAANPPSQAREAKPAPVDLQPPPPLARAGAPAPPPIAGGNAPSHLSEAKSALAEPQPPVSAPRAAVAVPPVATEEAPSHARDAKPAAAGAPPPAAVARAAAPAPPPLWAEPEASASADLAESEPRAESNPMRLATTQFERVTVQPGDSVSRIALKKYGQASHTILDLLKLANPSLHDVNVIAVGQTIQLPDLSESSVISYGDRRYGVLVYSTTQAARAAALESALRARGHHSRVTKGEFDTRRPVFRVVVGAFSDPAAAAAASRDLQRLFRDDARMAALVR